ncbi:MAG TPA: hypothetical protein PKE47_15110, partial [Verrucomicrobiota bacterium]|nr:hypothetical protein [Verrucomicrobiota bacterium]
MAVLLLTALLLLRHPSAEPSLPEATRAELVERDGRLHRPGEAAPFDGWLVDHYPDGARRSRSRLAAGLLGGGSERWYPDGTR